MNLLITQSGGTTTVINATLAGMVAEARRTRGFGRIYGGAPGIAGVLAGNAVDLTELSESDLRRLARTPGSSVIGTTRVAILNEEELDRIAATFQRNGIGFFVNVGGNGTIKQTRQIALRLGGGVACAAGPKTVDNDLGDADCRRMLFTPGFPSCVNFWKKKIQLLDVENRGACSHDQVLVAQTFGRRTGFLAGAARIADPGRTLPLLILLPEDERPLDAVVGAVDDLIRRRGRAIVVLAEGYDLGDLGERHDKTGQIMFGSSRTTAAQILVSALVDAGIAARSYIPTVDQRQCIDDTLEFDRDIAWRLGEHIIRELAAGKSSFLAAVQADSLEAPLTSIPFADFRDYSRALPVRFVAPGRFDVSDAYLDYLRSFFAYSRFETDYAGYAERFLGAPDVVALS